MLWKLPLFVVATILVALPSPSSPQGVVESQGIEAVVTDAAGTPIRGALIRFDRLDKNFKASLKTDKRGEFKHFGLSAGRYRVSASMPDGRPIDQKEVIVISGSMLRVDFSVSKSASDSK
jgi:hypothetical protein